MDDYIEKAGKSIDDAIEFFLKRIVFCCTLLQAAETVIFTKRTLTILKWFLAFEMMRY